MKGLKEEENLFILLLYDRIKSGRRNVLSYIWDTVRIVFPWASSKECYNKVLHDITD